MKQQQKIVLLCETALFTALIFIATFSLKLPGPFGYTHLGDCMIFLAVLMLGSRRGAAAGALGAALADLVGGYTVWILPTLLCKALMALVMGFCMERGTFLKGRTRWLTGAVFGGLLQCGGYFLARAVIYGAAAAVASIPGLLFQTGCGIVFALLLSEALKKTGLGSRFQWADQRVRQPSEAGASPQKNVAEGRQKEEY